jgi:oligoribonuclease NrnB/cAMP/cGMP phosphodiesterase (DHH superfamily)
MYRKKGFVNYLLITHNDLDGVACEILAKMAFGNDIEVCLVNNPQEVTNKLINLKTTGEWKNYQLIYITDCSFDMKKSHEMPKLKSQIKLFDHHTSAVESFKNCSWAIVVPTLHDRPTCGTELWYEYLLRKGYINPRPFFVELVRLYDTWEWKKQNSHIPEYLSTLLYAKGHSYFVQTYLERLKKSDVNELNIFNAYERDILEYEFYKKEVSLKKALENVKIIQTEKYKIGFSYASGDLSALGHAICNKYDVDFAIMINFNTNTINARTTKDIDLSQIMKTYFNGGGHPSAAGGKMDDDITTYLIGHTIGKISPIIGEEKL